MLRWMCDLTLRGRIWYAELMERLGLVYVEGVLSPGRLLCSAVVVFLFLAGLWFTEAIINGPNFHPKLTLVAPAIGYSVSCCVSC